VVHKHTLFEGVKGNVWGVALGDGTEADFEVSGRHLAVKSDQLLELGESERVGGAEFGFLLVELLVNELVGLRLLWLGCTGYSQHAVRNEAEDEGGLLNSLAGLVRLAKLLEVACIYVAHVARTLKLSH